MTFNRKIDGYSPLIHSDKDYLVWLYSFVGEYEISVYKIQESLYVFKKVLPKPTYSREQALEILQNWFKENDFREFLNEMDCNS